MDDQSTKQDIEELRRELGNVKRRNRARWFGWSMLVVLGLPAAAIALPAIPTHIFQSSTTISSAAVNENFAQLFEAVSAAEASITALQAENASQATAIAAVEASVDTKQNANATYSIDATFCGATAASYDGAAVGGYSGGKTKCEAACGDAAGAHMCTTVELIRMRTMGVGVGVARGWYSSGGHGLSGDTAASRDLRDCYGWTQADTSGVTGALGSIWHGNGDQSASWQGCSLASPILCCL